MLIDKSWGPGMLSLKAKMCSYKHEGLSRGRIKLLSAFHKGVSGSLCQGNIIWPKCSSGLFHCILWKNLNDTYGLTQYFGIKLPKSNGENMSKSQRWGGWWWDEERYAAKVLRTEKRLNPGRATLVLQPSVLYVDPKAVWYQA